METNSLSGKKISSLISRRLEGTWSSIADEAEKRFGSRGRTIAVLLRPRTLQGTKGGCEGILREAEFNVERALVLANVPDTLDGLRTAIAKVRRYVEEDVCLNFLRFGECSQDDCALKHYIPDEM